MNLDENITEQFVKSVLAKYQVYTQLGVYPIRLIKVESWIANFTDYKHRYIAAHMLDRLLYRSYRMAKESYKSFFVSIFRDFYFQSLKMPPDSIPDWLQKLSQGDKEYRNNLVVSPIRLALDSGGSGDLVCRLVGINQKYVKCLTADGISEGKHLRKPSGKVILLVDDILGSGKQINTFSSETGLQDLAKDNYIIYAPLLALERNLNTVRTQLPFIKILPIEAIDENQKFFSFQTGSNFIGDSGITEIEVREIYKDMLLSNGFKAKEAAFGRDKAALTLAFEWGCPNQTLGSLWWNETDNPNWSNLFEKRE
ncbi:MAG: hypothetical protein PSN44_03660 [Gammaproteobacteria bacterium]|nr:hypothetical protein [Gammaproteobacteria bacterium]